MQQAAMTVWRFDDADGAAEATRAIERTSSATGGAIRGAALVVWPKDEARPATRVSTSGDPDALGDPFWPLLFGLIFFAPLLGAAASTAPRESAGPLSGLGLGEVFVHSVRDHVTPGTAAVFVLADDDALDELRDTVLTPAELVTASLKRDAGALHDVFGQE